MSVGGVEYIGKPMAASEEHSWRSMPVSSIRDVAGAKVQKAWPMSSSHAGVVQLLWRSQSEVERSGDETSPQARIVLNSSHSCPMR